MLVTEAGLRTVLAAALASAMRRRDATELRVLRNALARVANAEAVPVEDVPTAGAWELAPYGANASDVPRRVLDESALRSLVLADIDEIDSAIRRVNEMGVSSRAADLQRDAEVLRNVLRHQGPSQC